MSDIKLDGHDYSKRGGPHVSLSIGDGVGEIAAGDHNHDHEYDPLGAAFDALQDAIDYIDEALANYVAGTNRQIQYNDDGILAGSTNLNFDKISGDFYIGKYGTIIDDMLVYTYNQATGIYTDISTVARSGLSTFTFTGTAVNNAIYISIDKQENGDYLKLSALRAALDTLRIGGTLVFEYWNGSSWSIINFMERSIACPYISYANNAYLNDYEVVTRLNWSMLADWAKNDPPVTGTNRYWIRIRISVVLTTAPIFTMFTLLLSCIAIMNDGFIKYYGCARPINQLIIDIGTLSPAFNAPASQDLLISDYLDVGRQYNSFANGAVDRIGMTICIPHNIDTSCPMQLCISTVPETVAAGDVEFRIRWGTSKNAASVYRTQAAAPVTAPDEQTTTKIKTLAIGDANKQVDISINLAVPQIITPQSGIVNGQLLWLTIERDGTAGNPADTYAGTINMIQLAIYFTAWSTGGHTRGQY